MVTVEPISYAAARRAVSAWHYSRSMPAGKMARLGVWEDGRFVGVVIFSRGASPGIASAFALDQTEAVELTRVALRDHASPVSQIVTAAVRRLREWNPGLRLVVSYADPRYGHHGGIYQAMNWIYVGQTSPSVVYFDANGRRHHSRMVSPSGRKKSFGRYRKVPRPDELRAVEEPGKHKYVLPLDRRTRRRVVPLAEPYPCPISS